MLAGHISYPINRMPCNLAGQTFPVVCVSSFECSVGRNDRTIADFRTNIKKTVIYLASTWRKPGDALI